ncbi:hypothetical protein DOTSEDRAFT_74435 [Dothistroma septosporum NZE10]|uniref:Uncharacterized protein n=1 Tax=Dothistroma septosporum (strain NZE10 / CBS 128990) TaxID=675120 RepID=N1PE34_DOTSN|nr:hypothetical protein DOTSEDRAFT_74435 [Dothistroma septosporum NZE10]
MTYKIPAHLQLHIIIDQDQLSQLPPRLQYSEAKGSVAIEVPIGITLPDLETTHLVEPPKYSIMGSLGLTRFRTALAFEILGNFSSIPSLLFYPDIALHIILKHPSLITPATRALTRIFGGVVAGLTIPLILSWPNPKPGNAGDEQRGFRKAAYLVQGTGEVFLGALFVWMWMSGKDHGVKEGVLLAGAANMGLLLGLRWVFLVWKPHLVEHVKEGEAKAKTQ